METNVYDRKQKKSIWAVLWESMTKTGGCCGGGGNCCGSSRPNNEQQQKVAKQDPAESIKV